MDLYPVPIITINCTICMLEESSDEGPCLLGQQHLDKTVFADEPLSCVQTHTPQQQSQQPIIPHSKGKAYVYCQSTPKYYERPWLNTRKQQRFKAQYESTAQYYKERQRHGHYEFIGRKQSHKKIAYMQKPVMTYVQKHNYRHPNRKDDYRRRLSKYKQSKRRSRNDYTWRNYEPRSHRDQFYQNQSQINIYTKTYTQTPLDRYIRQTPLDPYIRQTPLDHYIRQTPLDRQIMQTPQKSQMKTQKKKSDEQAQQQATELVAINLALDAVTINTPAHTTPIDYAINQATNNQPTFPCMTSEPIQVVSINFSLQQPKPIANFKPIIRANNYSFSQQLSSSLSDSPPPLTPIQRIFQQPPSMQQLYTFPMRIVVICFSWLGQITKIQFKRLTIQPLSLQFSPSEHSEICQPLQNAIRMRRDYCSEEKSSELRVCRVRVDPRLLVGVQDYGWKWVKVKTIQLRCFCKWKGQIWLDDEQSVHFSCEKCSYQQHMTINAIRLQEL